MNPQDFRRFYLGTLALNFLATFGRRSSERIERIPTPAHFGRWLVAADLLDPADAKPSARHYGEAIALREAIYRAVTATTAGNAPRKSDIERINACAASSRRGAAQLDPKTLRAQWHAAEPVRGALARIADDAIATLGSPETRKRLSLCEGQGCAIPVLSASRGAQRRWCSMQTCGNTAKVAAHRKRARAS